MRTQTIEKTLFTFDELSDSAKEKARDWYRADGPGDDWHDSVYEDAKNVAAILGIEVDKIYFSGFWSQGDGACFEGSYSYAKGSARKIREYAPLDSTLHAIADSLVAAQRHWFYKATATAQQRGHYQHSGCMAVTVEHYDGWGFTPSTNFDVEGELVDALRAFADWVYSSLEAEYEYLTSDESIDESIVANEYEFDENGNID